MKLALIIIILLLFGFCGGQAPIQQPIPQPVQQPVQHYDIDPSDVERWLTEGLRHSPETATLEALAELERWKLGPAFKKWHAHTGNPVEIYLPSNVTTDSCYFIRLKEDTPKILVDYLHGTLLDKWQGEIRHYYEKLMRGLLVCFKGGSSSEAIDSLKELPWIEYIERDCMISCGQVQKRAPWGLSRIAQPKRPLTMQFGFDVTGKGIDVYVLDSGIFSEHPEFGGRATLLYNAIDRVDYVGRSTTSKDCSGHGTEVASIIAGKWTGVAKRATIKAVQVLGCNGNGKNSDLIHALEWVATHRTGPSIIHLSLGGPKSRVLDDVVAAMTAGDIPVIIAAGNADRDACDFSPGGSRKAITVGAMTESDMRADYSNYGNCLSIFAPGDNILAATQPTTEKIAIKPPSLSKKSTASKGENHEKYLSNLAAIQPSTASIAQEATLYSDDELNMQPIELGYNEGYILSSGTSMAAPLVTGVFALLMEKYPGKSANQLWEIVQSLAINNILDPTTLKGSPNMLLQAPKYDSQSHKIIIPDLDDGTQGDNTVVEGSSSILPGLSLKIALFVLFIFVAVIILGLAILYWVLQARKKRSILTQPSTSATDPTALPMLIKESDFEDELGFPSPILDLRIDTAVTGVEAAKKPNYKPPSPTPTV